MFTPFIRILLIIVCLSTAVLFYLREDFYNAGLSILAAGFFVYGYFKYGTVYLAFQQLKKEKLDAAEKLVSKIKNPEILSKHQKSYYHFTLGMIAYDKNDLDFAKSELTKAHEIGLRTKNDTSIVLLNIANIEFKRNEIAAAEEYLDKLKGYELKPLLTSEMNKLKEKIKLAQQSTL